MLSFTEYKNKISENNTVGVHNDGAGGFSHGTVGFMNTAWTGSEQNPTMGLDGHSMHLPSIDAVFKMPMAKRVRKIVKVEIKKTPIEIYLDDNTIIKVTRDEFDRIAKKPEPGKILSVTFQRLPNDNSKEYSQISSIKVF